MGRDAKPKEQKQLQNRKPNKSPLDDMVTADPISIIDMQPPPEYLNEYALEEWHFITPELARMGIIAKVDKSAIAACCLAQARFRTAEEHLEKHGHTFKTQNGYETPSPHIAIANKSCELWLKFLKEFGLTAASRRKLSSEKPPGENEYEKWQKRKEKADTKRKK